MACIVYLPISYHTRTYLIQQGSTGFFFIMFLFLAIFLTDSGITDTDTRCALDLFFIIKRRGENNSDQYRYPISSLYPCSIHMYDCTVRLTLAHVDLLMSHTRVNLIYIGDDLAGGDTK